MTDKELRAQGKLGLLKLIRDNEAEIGRLDEESRWLCGLIGRIPDGCGADASCGGAPDAAPEDAPWMPETAAPERTQEYEIAQLVEENEELQRRMEETLSRIESLARGRRTPDEVPNIEWKGEGSEAIWNT